MMVKNYKKIIFNFYSGTKTLIFKMDYGFNIDDQDISQQISNQISQEIDLEILRDIEQEIDFVILREIFRKIDLELDFLNNKDLDIKK